MTMKRTVKMKDKQLGFEDYKLPVVRIKMMIDRELYSKEPIDSPEAAVLAMGDLIKDEDRELLCVINVDNRLRPLNAAVVSMGTITYTVAPIVNIFKAGILSNAGGIILMHNHPSGNVTPSKEDDDLTKRVYNLGKLMEIELYDHVIVGVDPSTQKMNYYSYQESYRLNDLSIANRDELVEMMVAEKKPRRRTSKKRKSI